MEFRLLGPVEAHEGGRIIPVGGAKQRALLAILLIQANKVIAVERGAIRFGLPATSEAVDLLPGDWLELPAGTRHDALVGPAGVSCLEAHLPAGTLVTVRHRAAGTW